MRQALPARYTVDVALGAGGQGSVFRGTVDGKPAALKLFTVVDDPRRVQREIDVLRQVTCPSLVKVLATDLVRITGTDVTLVAYELHSGGDLTAVLSQGSPSLTEKELAKIGHDVGAEIIERRRKSRGLASLAEAKRWPKWLATAARYGLGEAELARIKLLEVGDGM